MISFQNVSYAYPYSEQPAVQNCSFEVSPGELMLCTGASGCGKSTLVRLANGLCPHFFKGELQGSVVVRGRHNIERRLSEISQDVGTLFQDPELQFFATNVEDEIAFAHEWRATSPQAVRTAVNGAAERFQVQKLLAASVQDISEGEKQLVALASITSLSPKVLVLDEPSANLDPEATERLARHLGELKQQGMAILVVDHRLYWLAEIADKVLIMDQGRVAALGDFSLLKGEALRAKYGLRKPQVQDPRLQLPCATHLESSLEVRNLHFGYKNCPPLFQNVSFSLPDAVVGVFGDNGTGKTTLARLLTGLQPMKQGTLLLEGRQLSGRQLLAKSSLVLQNADHQLHMSRASKELEVAANGIARKDRGAVVDELLQRFNLSHLSSRHPQSLSGGEKQRLSIACGLAKRPRVLILDEPTSGLDGRNMALIAKAVRATATQGACVLCISHDLELMDLVCDAALRFPLESHEKETTAEKEIAHVSCETDTRNA